MSTRSKNVEYLLDQIDTVLELKTETLIKTSFKNVLVSLNKLKLIFYGIFCKIWF